MATKKPYILLAPGPVPVTNSVRDILSKQSVYHRGTEFQNILKNSKKNLAKFFQTQESVMILSSTGTGSMEAAISNTLSPQDEVLCLCYGKFGERWKEIATRYNLKIHTINAPWGDTVNPKDIESYLEKNKNIKAVFATACETSTATEQDMEGISKVLKPKSDILFIVDGISALGAMPLPMDELGIDVLIGGSQKSFAIPTGFAFIALSKKAWEFQKKSKCPKFYFDLEKTKKAEDKGESPFSLNANLLQSLEDSLDNIVEKQGLENHILRCRQLAKATHEFAKSMGLSLLSKNPSAAVTAINMPKSISGNQIKSLMEKNHNVIVAGGQDILKDKIVRFGHLGAIKNEDLLGGLEAFGEEMHNADQKQFPKDKIKKSLQLAKQKLENNS